MKKRVFIVGLLLLMIVFSGCGKVDKGPKELGMAVFEALKAKDVDAYLDLCLTIKDKKFLIFLSELTMEEKKVQKALISTSRRAIYETKDIRTANFNDIASLSGWENAVVKKISLKKRFKEHGMLFYEEVIVKFKQSKLPDLKIGKIVKTRDKWKIMDDQALGFLSMI